MKPRVAAALFLAISLAARASPTVETISVTGSDTLVILVQRWAEAFMRRHPEGKVQVTGGGTGTGIAALLNASTNLAAASRPMTNEEQRELRERTGEGAQAWVVARDAVTFYVNAQNPIDALSLEQLRRLYLGELTRWTQVGGADLPVSLYSRESSSGTYAFVKDRLLRNEDLAVETQTLPGTAAVVRAVSLEPWALGYGGAAFGHNVKQLKLRQATGDALAPTPESVASGRYPLIRDLYLYTRGVPSGATRAFIDFALSDEGQKWVERVGYYPVR